MSDLLSICRELCLVFSRLNHTSDASDETRIGLRMGLKWTLNQNYVGCWNSAAQRADDVSVKLMVSAAARSARGGASGSESVRLEPMASRSKSARERLVELMTSQAELMMSAGEFSKSESGWIWLRTGRVLCGSENLNATNISPPYLFNCSQRSSWRRKLSRRRLLSL